MVKIRKSVLCVFAVIIVCFAITVSFFESEKPYVLNSSPSNIVLNKWYGKNDVRSYIINTPINEQKLYKAALPELPFKQTKLIIKTDNLRLLVYTKGKILFTNTEKRLCGYGQSTHIIDISDLKKQSEIYILPVPVDAKGGRIVSDIIISTSNDYLFEVLFSNAVYILLLSAITAAFFFFLIKGAIRCYKKKTTAAKELYLVCCMFDLLIVILTKNDISQFVISGDVSRYLTHFCALNLTGIFTSSYLCAAFKIKSKAVNALMTLSLTYTMIRVLLFICFLTPLSNAVIISHIIITFCIITPIILKLRLDLRQSSYILDYC